MARPLKWKSNDAATETETGRAQSTKGHDEFGLYVKAYDGFDPANDTLEVRVEGSVDEGNVDGNVEDYAPIDRGAPAVEDVLSITQDGVRESDENDGVYVGYIGSNSFPVESLRASIKAHSGGFSVDTYVLATGSTQAAYRYSTPDSA